MTDRRLHLVQQREETHNGIQSAIVRIKKLVTIKREVSIQWNYLKAKCLWYKGIYIKIRAKQNLLK